MKITEKLKRRFNKKISKGVNCWIWKGGASRGYGKFWVDGKIRQAHVVAWVIEHGPVPKNKVVMHDCPGGDERSCVNPDHLKLGTQQQNMDDMKGRSSNGRPSQRMTAEIVRLVRMDRAGGATYKTLRDVYGFEEISLWRVVNLKTWKNVV